MLNKVLRRIDFFFRLSCGYTQFYATLQNKFHKSLSERFYINVLDQTWLFLAQELDKAFQFRLEFKNSASNKLSHLSNSYAKFQLTKICFLELLRNLFAYAIKDFGQVYTEDQKKLLKILPFKIVRAVLILCLN